MEKFHNSQIDYIKLKLYKVDSSTIKWDSLVPHPNLKRHYGLNQSVENYYTKNLELYIDTDNNITIKTSIPYLVNGQNYSDEKTLSIISVFEDLKVITGLDIPNAKVLEFEYGGYLNINLDPKIYLKSIKGILNYDLLKSTSYMKMFGNKNLHYKIYDAVANSKVKKTYLKAGFNSQKVIKHEIKFLKPEIVFKRTFKALDLCSNDVVDDLRNRIDVCFKNLVTADGFEYEPVEKTITHILFTTLKNIETELSRNIISQILQVIEGMKLTASQKSKRIKTLTSLENIYNNQKNN